MTDDSGGHGSGPRCRAISIRDRVVADELSKQYHLGFSGGGKKDGRWHTIRVEVRSGRYTVRARKGYVAS